MKRPFGGRWVGGAAFAFALLALSACEGESTNEDEDGDDDDPSRYCQRIGAKLNGCGMGALLEDIDDCEEPADEEESCTSECVIDASCDEIRTLVCSNSVSPNLQECVLGCLPPPFTCGSGDTIDETWVCDGFADCLDGSDEMQNCPTCSDGTPLPSYARCDGFTDCPDGRDEAACPTFRCGSGETVPVDFECDYFPDCADGSDEHAGCPDTFVCRSGEIYPDSFECDGYPDCLDGSDEHSGCPSVTCADGSQVFGVRCDGYYDCIDGSDEPANCPPTPEEEICGT